jgi:hypothetical protein
MPLQVVDSTPLPRWARLLDFVGVGLLAFSVIVAMSGGFRLYAAGLRIGVTSPYRPLLWALVVAVIRHVAAPQHPVYREVPRQVAEWFHVPAVRAAAMPFVGTRPAMLFVGYLAVLMIGYEGGRLPLRFFNNDIMNLPVRWDAGWYLQIVTDGYKFVPNEPERQQNIVFFPAYPMLVRVVGRLFGGQTTGYVTAGLVVSLVAFLGALIYIYAFARDALGDDKARYALWLVASYPFALFFGAIYTESLFLLGTAGSFYHFNRLQFARAALWGIVVGLTRVNGVFLTVPLGVLAISPWLPPMVRRIQRADEAKVVPAQPARLLVKALAAAAAPVFGLLLYGAFVWRTTGDPLAWASGHVAWGRTYEGLGRLVASQYSFIADVGLESYLSNRGYDAMNAIGGLFALATVWPVARRLGLAYALFILINTIVPFANGGLISLGRFSAVLFPSFIWLADAIPASHRVSWITSFAAIQAFNSALFHTWRPLF